MPNTRPFLLLAVLFVGYLLWQQWQTDYAAPPSVTSPAAITNTASGDAAKAVPNDVPAAPGEIPKPPADAATTTSPATTAPAQLVNITTDVFNISIDTRGGAIVRADLRAYPIAPKETDHPVRLLSDDATNFFIAQSGLVSAASPAPDHQAQFSAEKTEYTLADGSDTLEVPLTWTDASGIKVRKVYKFTRASYAVEQREEISNAGTTPWSGSEYRQLQRLPVVIVSSGFSFSNPEKFAFAGAAWYSPQDKFQKLGFDKYAATPLNKTITGGWVGMLQHYFFAAWVPKADEADQYSTAVVTNAGTPRYLIRSMSPAITVAPGETKSFDARLYIGPKLQSTLATVAPGLELTVDYGMFTVISQPLHWILSEIHRFVGNWGFAIILLVVLIKLAFYKLSEAQFKSSAKMKKVQPRLAALKERYGDDKQKLNAAMLELYQKEKINPVSGCLPMLVQFPVFLALYWVLLESVELRQAPFMLWIQNLSAPDPYFVLPILNAGVMLATQFLTPTVGMDPTQAKMMKAMPVMMAVMFAFFPAGLVLYWTVNGGLSLLQQYVITKRIESGAIAVA
ncbi:membrane protein insertase YidC [Pseudolysobacter antarcticus]|uniref:Membrane protein insertase YidC n=1 Tax=Pseudolysobacter antarcticus TaxID=2511995 RepID=A0A411HPV3_9GAMM|nr:membrane protein insertase YidC [Pseudolysobacter antarcticus]QBB72497.1 membrane protein insertase YidC [Pseudolysobacter antarcticus]